MYRHGSVQIQQSSEQDGGEMNRYGNHHRIPIGYHKGGEEGLNCLLLAEVVPFALG